MNRNNILFVLAGAAMLVTASCSKPASEETIPAGDGLVYVTVSVDPENGSKATIAETGGAFAFSNGDQIKIFDGTAVFTGSTVSETNDGVFAMPDGFNLSGSGFAGFPASLVSNISAGGVTFSLPSSYSFSQVGGVYDNPATDKPKTTTPMMGTYSSSTTGDHITLKQACSMVRFRLQKEGIGPGQIEFLFHNRVCGSVTLAATPTEKSTSAGIVSGSLSGSAAITVTISSEEWVATGESTYIYISLPVPSGTVIDNGDNTVYVTWTSANSAQIKTGSAKPAAPATSFTLNRADACRVPASVATVVAGPTYKVAADRTVVLAPGNLMALIDHLDTENMCASVSEWKFGGPMEFIGGDVHAGNILFANGNSDCEGKWIDFLSFQGVSAENKVQGVYYRAINDVVFGGNVLNESLYEGCWTTRNNNESPATGNYIHITNGGGYDWRPMTKDEWIYLLAGRPGAKVNGLDGVTCSRVKVAGINGLLIYPDTYNSGDGTWTEIWNSTTMGTAPTERVRGAYGGSDPEDDGYGEFDMYHDNEYGDFLNYKVGYTWASSAENYTPAQLNAMRTEGIVFLPCTGCRFGTTLSHETQRGYYWSSTGSGANTQYAFYMGPFESQLCPSYPVNRHAGRFVRLVREVD